MNVWLTHAPTKSAAEQTRVSHVSCLVPACLPVGRPEVPLMMVLLRLIYGQTAVLEGLELEEALHLMSLCDRYDAPGCLRQCAERVLSSGLLQSVEDADRCIDFVRSMPPHFAQAAGASDLLKKAQEVGHRRTARQGAGDGRQVGLMVGLGWFVCRCLFISSGTWMPASSTTHHSMTSRSTRRSRS